jgi:hypothetical protein
MVSRPDNMTLPTARRSITPATVPNMILISRATVTVVAWSILPELPRHFAAISLEKA